MTYSAKQNQAVEFVIDFIATFVVSFACGSLMSLVADVKWWCGGLACFGAMFLLRWLRSQQVV